MDNPETLNYSDGWKPVYNPVVYDSAEAVSEEPVKEKKKTKEGKPFLLTIQIILCVTAVLSLYALKSFSPDYFKEVYNWYDKNLNNEVILTETFKDFSLDNLINAVSGK